MDGTGEETALKDAGRTGPRRRQRPTLKTVAGETGLAVTTVSRALNDAPDIGEETKARVREAAARVGYVRDRAAHRLRTGRTNVISLLMTPETDPLNHTARLIHGLASELRGTPFHLVLTPVLRDEDPLVQVRHVTETQAADAIVINAVRPDDARIAYMARAGMPFATHGRSSMTHPFYDFDNAAFARLAVGEMARRGRRRLLIVAPPQDQSYGQHVMEGARAACAAHGVGWERLETATTDAPLEVLEPAIGAALARGPSGGGAGGFDAILTASAISAMASACAAEALGLRVGGEFDIASKEAQPFLRRFRPGIITVREDMSAAGAFLARAAMAAIADPGAPPMTHLDVPGAEDLE